MKQEFRNAQDRTAAKIRFARIHLEELLHYPQKGSGDDFERSHVESFLFHLFGARDAFLQELNLYYGCQLPVHKVTMPSMQDWLKKKGVDSPELYDLHNLENSQGSWLNDAKEMRDHSTHRNSIPRVFFVGGVEDRQVHLKNPKTGKSLEEDYILSFEKWLTKMDELLNNLRNRIMK